MLDKHKVSLMTELAMYEQNQGKEDFKTNEYYQNDYAEFHTICSIIWITIGYAGLVMLFVFAAFDTIVENLSKTMILMMGGGICIGYVVVLSVYVLLSQYIFRKRHKSASKRIGRFNRKLTRLLEMYEE